ncbi:hypothetical protein AMTRI_Chr04g183710 [Amborella trichopoda]
MRRVGGPQQSRTQEGMVVCHCGGLICNTRQTQARDPSKFLQSRSRLSCREEESIGLKVEPLNKCLKEGKFTWQEVMVKILTIEIEAKKAMSSRHCRVGKNQPLN